jgi:hypothetical protein
MPEKHHKTLHESKTVTTVTHESSSSEATGFKLPNPDAPPATAATPPPANPAPPAAPANAVGQAAAAPPSDLPPTGQADTSARDLAVGGAVWLVFLVAFLIVKNAYANHLVRDKVSPHSANAAGWWLFVFLGSLAMMGVLGFVNQEQFFTPTYLAAFSAVALAALIGFLLTGRR